MGSMPEMADAGQDHGKAVLIACGDALVVTHRSTWLNNGRDASRSGEVDVVAEGKESVGSQDRALAPLARLANRHMDGIDSAHLPGPNADYHAAPGQDDRVALDVLAHQPGET